MSKIKLATVWLDGCSGCHMSLLDIDEQIALVAKRADIVYGPLVDAQEFPEGVDVTLVEGAVANQDDLKLIQTHPQAQPDDRVAGRLRGHRQRARDAQRDSRQAAARARLRGGRQTPTRRRPPMACPRC